jgi:hypothetical protein
MSSDKDNEKKRGRPSLDGKKKKQKTKISLEEISDKVSKNLDSPFVYHNDWLQEILPTNLEELYNLRLSLEPNNSVIPLSEINMMITDNLEHLNGNVEMFEKINNSLENFVDDNMEDVILTLLENFTDKVKVLIENRKEKVHSIIRKSIGVKMFPELKNVIQEKED